MKETLLLNLKNYKESLELFLAERKDLIKELNDFSKLVKMGEEIKKHGGVIELPNIEEKKLLLEGIEINIKVCKSIIRRYESVYSMYYGEKDTQVEEVEEEKSENVIETI